MLVNAPLNDEEMVKNGCIVSVRIPCWYAF